MADVVLADLNKTYPNGYQAVTDLNLRIADGESLALYGPPGAGKSTALRMIAGLEEVSSGEVRIGGRVVNDVHPKDRGVAMVFQNYALYPHLDVAENIGFALKLARLPLEEIEQRVRWAAGVLGLEDHLGKKPGELSSGQRQRVAMGRAIVRRPAAFLMDEPLSNLDVEARAAIRDEIAQLQRQLAVTTVYVTEDRAEAAAMGDRVAVLRRGHLQQVGALQELLDRPANAFVARAVGDPAMNLFRATLRGTAAEPVLHLGDQALALDPEAAPWGAALGAGRDVEVVVGIRPERLRLATDAPPAPGEGRLLARAAGADAGRPEVLWCAIDVEPSTAVDAELEGDDAGSAPRRGPHHGPYAACIEPGRRVAPGEAIELALATADLRAFDPVTGVALA